MPQKSKQSVESKLLRRIHSHKRGWAFTAGDFADLGSRSAVGMALKGICDRGVIRRLSRGLYQYPRQHPTLGELSPTVDEIAAGLAGRDSLRIQPAGAYAANLLGLTEQVPAKAVFLTDGKARKVRVGSQEIELKPTTPRNMATAGKVSGLVIQALRHWGKENFTEEELRKLKSKLTPDQRRKLQSDIRFAPAWIGEILRELAREEDG